MKLLAQKRAEQSNLDFGEIFAQQYVILKGDNYQIEGMTCFALSGWSFCLGKQVHHFSVLLPRFGGTLVFIGVGVDEEGQLVTQERLIQLSLSLSTRQALCDYLNASAGRFVFVLLSDGANHLYGDASASMATYYTPSAGLIGCSQLLALDSEVQANEGYPGFADASIPGGSFNFTHTADVRCRQLLANHYLNLDTWKQERFWPTDDDDFTCPTNKSAIEARVDFLVRRQQQVIATLAKAHSPCYLPISGGSDSRTLLAFAKPVLGDVDPFVHIMGWTSRCDAFVARDLAKLYDLKLTELDALNDDCVKLPPSRHEEELIGLGLSQGIIHSKPERKFGVTDTIAALPKGGLVLRGQIINISKGYHLGRKYISEFKDTYGKKHYPWTGMRALELNWSDDAEKKWLRDNYIEWAESLPDGAKLRVVDFAMVEQHRTHSMGRFLNLFSRSFYMSPACDRACIKAMISIPPHLRYHLYIHDMIFQQAAPELLKIPYHKLFSDYFERFRHSDTLEEQLARLPERV